MSKKEDIKENLLNLNSYLQALLTSLIALVGFTFSVICEIIKTGSGVIAICLIAIIAICATIFIIQKRIINLRKELRRLK